MLLICVMAIPAIGLAEFRTDMKKNHGDGADNKGEKKKWGKFKPDQIIVRFKHDFKEERRKVVREMNGLRWLRTLPTKSELLEISDGSSVEEAVTRMIANPNVLHAQPNFAYQTYDLPDDTFFNLLWGLDNIGQYIGGSTNGVGVVNMDIDAPEAWEITQGTPDIVVGVIDTAIDISHPDLAANIWTNPGEIDGDNIDNDHNGFTDDLHGWDFYNDHASVYESGDHYHGTHVAGTIAAIANNSEGVTGVAPGVKIMPLQFIGPDGWGYTSDALGALNYAQMMGVRVTNNSWGGSEFDAELHDAICGYDGVFVAAAGNSSGNSDNAPLYPAAYDCPNIISVAALNNRGELAFFSNYGATSVDIGAPGLDIVSSIPEGSYAYLSGTSMASPHVTGIVALMLSMQPGLSGPDVRNMLITTAKPLASLQGLTVSGGMASAFNAVHDLQAISDPKDGAIEVPLDKIITVNYVVDVLQGPNFDAITLKSGDQNVPITRTLNSRSLLLTPQALLEINKTYSVTIPAGAVKNTAGVDLRGYSFSFKTHDSVPPQMVSTDPVNNDSNVSGTKTITVVFDEDVKGGANYTNITLMNGTSLIPATVSVAKNVLTIDPIYTLASSASYSVTVPFDAITDRAGNQAASYSFGFSTANDVTPPVYVSSSPPTGMREVPTDTNIIFVFSKDIQLDTNSSHISVGCDGEMSTLELSVSNNVLTIHPVNRMKSSALCMVGVPAGAVKDMIGNSLTDSCGAYFWTRDDVPPQITSTDPANGATQVPATKQITVSFSEDVLPGPNFSGITLKDQNNNNVPFSIGYLEDGYGFSYTWIMAVTPLDVLGSQKTYTVNFPAGAVADWSPQRNPAPAVQFSFTTVKDTVPPVVTTSDPSPGSKEVPLNKVITVNFSEKVAQGSNFAAITLKTGTTSVLASVSLNATNLTIAPSANLNNDTMYTVTVPAGAINDIAGNPLAGAFTFSFTTPDTVPPYVVNIWADGANVVVTRQVGIVWSEDSSPGPNFAAISIKDQAGNTVPVTSGFYEDEEGPVKTYLIITASAALNYNTTYTVTLPAGAVVDMKGNASLFYSFSFSTPYLVTASDPVNGATGVALDKTIILTLNGPGTQGTNFNSISLKNGTTTVSAAVTLNGATLTIKPTANLQANVAYTVNIPAGAIVSTVGIAVAPSSLNFRTLDPNIPKVTSTDPANGAIGVPINTIISVAYNKSTVQGPNFSGINLKDENGSPVPVNTDYYCDEYGCLDFVLVLTPYGPLANNKAYTVTLPAGALRDLSGNNTELYTFSFRTQ